MPDLLDQKTYLNTLDAALKQHSAKDGSLLPILHYIQNHLGYIPDSLVYPLSQSINQSRAEIHGVISFYTHFRTSPPAPVLLEICRAEACQARGANAFIAQTKKQLGCDFHEVSADGKISLEPVYCLGLCAQGPVAMINNKPVAHLSSERLKQLLAEQGVEK